MDYVKFISTIADAFTVTSGTVFSGVDPDYMIDEYNVWSGPDNSFPLQQIESYLCTVNPLVYGFMTPEEINDYTTYSGGA